MRRRVMGRGRSWLWLLGLATAAAPLGAQELADFDYENLSFRGFSLEFGHLWANRVEDANTVGLRVDLGYLGPGLRIVPTISYWSSQLVGSEVAALEASVERLINREAPGTAPDVDLGTIDWSDFAVGFDAQIVWSVPFNLLTFAGVGAGVHFLNGDGEAIRDTFVEDLLDSAYAGINVHTGLEYPWERFRLYTEGRFELLEDLNYFELRVGGQIMVGPSAPGERGG